MIVVARPTGPNGLSPDLLERLLLGCGRPLLIAPQRLSHPLLGTVVVCWKETAEAAHAVGAAMPLLVKAERVILAGAEEDDPSLTDGLADLSRQLAWHGVSVDVEFMSSTAGPASKVLMEAARSHQAGLLIMGGYGHSHTREIVFGGFTQSVLESAEMTVFLIH